MQPSYYLIWKEKTTNNYHYRKFPNLDILNDFLIALRADNLEEVKIISGFTLEERQCG